MFAFALDNRTSLPAAAPGLFWAAVLLAALLAIGRSFTIEEAERARDGLRLSGLDGGAIFVGKAAAIAVELFLLEVVLGAAVIALYGVTVRGAVVLVIAAVAATVGLSATGTVYGVLATGLRARGHARALARLAGGHAGDVGCFSGVCGGARRVQLRRLALGAAARRVLGAGGRGGHHGLRPAVGGVVSVLKRYWFGASVVVVLAITALFALVISPPDEEQGNVVRLLYLHVPTIWIAFLAFFITALASALWLIPRTRRTGVGPARRRVGRSRCGVHGHHADRGVGMGPADVGHVLGLGRVAHDHRDPVLPLPRLPRVAAHGRDLRRARQAVRDRGIDRVRRRADRALLGARGGRRCTSRARCSTASSCRGSAG